ncbi:putative fork head domain-containing protein [Colletotrichum sublineola]|uniref:Putative fork head domain-containing protein n=1 Tax=Colletotrichum sublineola TaxID=1173701 RepID=A0A066X6J7_COLSU|nr:putative fork head domain-containing protein [Colletotrichum sublineola]
MNQTTWTVDNHGQVDFGNGAFQNGLEQPTNALVSRYNSSPAHVLGKSMVESVAPELIQQTLPTTSASVQEKVDSAKPCAKLIHEALKEAENNTMALQELYKCLRHDPMLAFEKAEKASVLPCDGRKARSRKEMSAWTLNRNNIETVKPTANSRKRGQYGPRKVLSGRLGTGRNSDPPYVTPVMRYPDPANASWRFSGHHLQNAPQEESEDTRSIGDTGSVSTMASICSYCELAGIGFEGNLDGSLGYNARLSAAVMTTIDGVPSQSY